MDEFELFRAQAYCGGMSSSPSASSAAASAAEKSSHYLHDNTSGSANARRRRHSSVALTQEGSAVNGSDPTHLPHLARDRRHKLRTGASAQYHQSLDYYGADDARDAVVANVTVAIEPPSPTETRRQLNITSSSSSSTPSAAGAVAGETEHHHHHHHHHHEDDDDCDHYGDLQSDVKRRPNKSPLRRRVTSPETVIKSSPQAEVTSAVGIESTTTTTTTEAIVEDSSSQSAADQDLDMHSYLLTLPSLTGSSPGQQSRRTDDGSSGLLPTSTDGSPRRNSCTGLVQSFSSIPLTPPRPTSRRNSAVTYLPEMPQGRPRSGY